MKKSENSKNSNGKIYGSVFGCFGVLLIAGIIFYFYKKKKNTTNKIQNYSIDFETIFNLFTNSELFDYYLCYLKTQ